MAEVVLRVPYTVGIGIRSQFRVYLDLQDLQYTEHKQFLQSVFIVAVNKSQHDRIVESWSMTDPS